MIDELVGKEVGTIQYHEGNKGVEKFWLCGLSNIKHTHIIINTWVTSTRVGNWKYQRVGGGVDFTISYNQTWTYYYAYHLGVDNNNNNCMGRLSLKGKKISLTYAPSANLASSSISCS